MKNFIITFACWGIFFFQTSAHIPYTTHLYDNSHITQRNTSTSSPKITQVDIVSTTPCDYDPSYYDAVVDIYYEGSNNLFADLEEEGSSYIHSYYSKEPNYTRLIIKDIDSQTKAILHILVRNDYGIAECSIVLSLDSHQTNIENNKAALEYNEHIEVYSLTGNRLYTIQSPEEISNIKGQILILKKTGKSGKLWTRKIVR